MLYNQIVPLLLIFLIGLAGSLVTLFKISPCVGFDPNTFCRSYSSIGLLLMGLSLLFVLTGILSIIGYLIRYHLYKKESLPLHYNTSLRQGILLSLTVLIILAMIIFGIFKWWAVIALLGVVILIEFYFSRQTQ